MKQPLRLGTRQSPLALWQTHHVRDLLRQAHPGTEVAIVKILTEGDRLQSAPLAEFGGKGLFLKELEYALSDKRIDVAVHSMKDVTVTMPPGLDIAAMCRRADPRDALLGNHDGGFDELPQGAVVGTCSLRRRCQLLHARPDLVVRNLRGNVQTRLARLDNRDYDAIVLAVAGLERLGLEKRISQLLPESLCLPAAGQGAIGLQTRSDDDETRVLLQALDHAPTRRAVTAERAVNRALNCNCNMPVASYARAVGDDLLLTAMAGSADGGAVLRDEQRGPGERATTIGETLGARLLEQGAAALLASGGAHE